jgi:hypothetical protein
MFDHPGQNHLSRSANGFETPRSDDDDLMQDSAETLPSLFSYFCASELVYLS